MGVSRTGSGPQSAAVGSKFADLRVRLVSGVVLAALALSLTWKGVPTFAILVGLVTLAMAWEWSTIVRGSDTDAALVSHMGGVAAAVVLAATGHPLLALVALAVALVLVTVLAAGRGALMSGVGVLYVGLPAIALIWLRADPTHGFAGIMFLFLVVWTSDIGAFLAGRLIGGPKLWPRVSPNKTWAGLIGGLLAAAVGAGAFSWLALGAGSALGLVLSALVLALVAQCGDLAESALKRAYGVKDASGLIPGHGGFMDRVDSLVTVAVVAAALALVVNGHVPARALLLGY